MRGTWASPTGSVLARTVKLLLLLAVSVSLGATAPTASATGLTDEVSASHYRLGNSGILTPAEGKALAAAGVTTTKELVDSAGPKRSRKALATKTKLTSARLWALAQTCDLLRISGLGMSMAKLLTAGGVPDTAALRGSRADSLASQLKATNAKSRIAEIVPDVHTLRSWIGQAKQLTSIIEP